MLTTENRGSIDFFCISFLIKVVILLQCSESQKSQNLIYMIINKIINLKFIRNKLRHVYKI